MTAKPTTLVTFLLDRTHSMQRRAPATIEGFNGYLGTLQAEKDADIDFTLIQFDHYGNAACLETSCIAVPVAEVPMLTPDTYRPRGGTPLIEAAIVTINAVDASLKQRDDAPKVIVCIQTDGEENASNAEYTWDALRSLIAAKQADGWEFNFMGAGINAYQQGARMGVSAANTMSYGDGREEVKAAFSTSALNAGSFAAGRSLNTAYSMGDRMRAGDRFYPDVVRDTGLPGATPATLPPSVVHPAPQPAPKNLNLAMIPGNHDLPQAFASRATRGLDLTKSCLPDAHAIPASSSAALDLTKR